MEREEAKTTDLGWDRPFWEEEGYRALGVY
jgi:hypothetical protein